MNSTIILHAWKTNQEIRITGTIMRIYASSTEPYTDIEWVDSNGEKHQERVKESSLKIGELTKIPFQ